MKIERDTVSVTTLPEASLVYCLACNCHYLEDCTTDRAHAIVTIDAAASTGDRGLRARR